MCDPVCESVRNVVCVNLPKMLCVLQCVSLSEMLCVVLCVNPFEMLCVTLCVSPSEMLCVVLCVNLLEMLCVVLCVSLSLLRNLLVTLGNLDYFMCQKAFHIIHEIIAKPYQNLSILNILIVFCLNIRTDRVA